MVQFFERAKVVGQILRKQIPKRERLLRSELTSIRNIIVVLYYNAKIVDIFGPSVNESFEFLKITEKTIRIFIFLFSSFE